MFYYVIMFVLFQVGTLDVLVGLSDDLGKLDAFIERYVLILLIISIQVAHYSVVKDLDILQNHCVCSTEDIFLQLFLEILKYLL